MIKEDKLTQIAKIIIGTLSSMIVFIFVWEFKFRMNLSEKYVLREEFTRVVEMNERVNREDHRIIQQKCDTILLKLSK